MRGPAPPGPNGLTGHTPAACGRSIAGCRRAPRARRSPTDVPKERRIATRSLALCGHGVEHDRVRRFAVEELKATGVQCVEHVLDRLEGAYPASGTPTKRDQPGQEHHTLADKQQPRVVAFVRRPPVNIESTHSSTALLTDRSIGTVKQSDRSCPPGVGTDGESGCASGSRFTPSVERWVESIAQGSVSGDGPRSSSTPVPSFQWRRRPDPAAKMPTSIT